MTARTVTHPTVHGDACHRSPCRPHIDCLYWVKRDSYLPQGSQGLKAVTKVCLCCADRVGLGGGAGISSVLRSVGFLTPPLCWEGGSNPLPLRLRDSHFIYPGGGQDCAIFFQNSKIQGWGRVGTCAQGSVEWLPTHLHICGVPSRTPINHSHQHIQPAFPPVGIPALCRRQSWGTTHWRSTRRTC